MPNATKRNDRNIAVFFGDRTFPKDGRGRSSKKFKQAIGKLAKVLKELDLHHVYLPSYFGTNMMAAIVLKSLDIPYTLVIPHPSFGGMSSVRSRKKLSTASEEANKTIMFGTEGEHDSLGYDVEVVTEDLVDYITRHCNSIIIASSEEVTPKFSELLSRFGEDAFEKAFTFTY